MRSQSLHQSSLWLHLLLLSALCAVLYFPYLGTIPFFDRGEPREAVAVQDIVRRGEWLFPLKGNAGIPSKPPLFHWSAALTSQAVGELNEATIRFPSALYATFGVLLTYGLGRRLLGARVAFFGGAILATTLVYGDQAQSARVDMTLCFFVVSTLVLFYYLYREFLTHTLWYFMFYVVVGIGALAKGPLGILLPGLVIGTFLALRKRWDLVRKFCFHPGILLTILLAAGWYALAVTRGGEDFVDRQLLQENLNRFFGGSGHSHPVYYYIPYLFSQGLPWSLFLPFLLWDSCKKSSSLRDDQLFLRLWFLVPFVFFSLSAGKRPVYLLPLYPALSLLTALWFYDQENATGSRLWFYRMIALFSGLTGLVLLIISLGGTWNYGSGWFFASLAELLKEKDRANLFVVKNAFDDFGWLFTLLALASSLLWFSLSHCLWTSKLRPAASRLLLIFLLFAFLSQGIVMPVIAAAKSYRPFMEEVNRRVTAEDRLYLYGGFINSDPVVFYRGAPIERLDHPPEALAGKIGTGNAYIIMARQTWAEIQSHNTRLPPPILVGTGTGPEGDAPLVLVQGGGW